MNSHSPSHCFRSILSPHILKFLLTKRSLGKRYTNEEKALWLLDRYLIEEQIDTKDDITPEIIVSFLASRHRRSPRSYNHLLSILNRLFDWLVSQNIVLSSPVQAKPKPTTSHKDPYIFSSFQVQQILKEAERLPDNQMAPLRGRTYRMIFSLLYALGMRVGEVARLEFRDVDVDRELLVIRETKFAKTRLVPYGPRVSEALRSYINQQQEYYGQLEEDQPLFSFRRKQKLPVCPTTISGVFHKLVLELNFNVPPGVTTPHLHCLRHSFAVNTLLRWYQTGDDPAGKLIHLSTFMGHVSPSSTAVYLTITNDFLECANEYFERFARQTIKGGLS